MLYRPLGRTGLKVSVLGFGASPLGGVFGPVADAEAERAVRTAIDLGVNLFDTSPFYGLTASERVLGQCLVGVPRERYLLATKVGRYGQDEFDFSAARVTASVEASLARLRCGHIDLVQCHDIEFTSAAQIVDETLPALRRLRDQGKVRFIGVTGLPLAALRAVVERCAVDSVLSYCRYGLHDTALAALLPGLQARGVGVLSAAPLAMGLLNAGGGPDWHPADPELKAACQRAWRHCQERGADLGRLAVQFALAHPGIASTFVGIASTAEVERNAACVGTAPDAQLLAEVLAILAPVQGRTWPSGLPANQDPGVTASSAAHSPGSL